MEHALIEPRANSLLFGHEDVEAMLLSDIQQQRLHHAYLLCGPKGIGKATLAYRFARYLLANDAVSARTLEAAQSMSLFAALDEPDQPVTHVAPAHGAVASSLFMSEDAPIFKRVAGASHTDLLTLSPLFDAKKQQEKAEISVDQARKVPSFLSLTPAESSWRVVIIDAVDQLNTQSSNALLKILEEPPENSILLLVCHTVGAVLPTIRSRCRKVMMAPCSRDDFARVLQHMAPHIPSNLYPSLYALSSGSPGQAVHYHAQHAAETYAALLHALRPEATAADRQKFADGSASVKSPAAWNMLVEMWQLLAQRVYLSAAHALPELMKGEPAILEALRTQFSIDVWCRYQEKMRSLLGQTAVFHLDKRETALLMVSPALILNMQAA